MPIRINSAVNGFRRAGVAHPNKPTDYPDDFFSKSELAQLEAEPRLVVEFIKSEEADQPDSSAGQEGALEPDSISDGLIEGHLDGVVEPDGTQKSLEEMDEEDVRQLGKDLGIRSYHSMGLDKLIEKIREEKVQVPAEGEA